MENETLRAIQTRRSNRSFTDEQITPEELHAILESGLVAPFAGPRPNRHFSAVQNPEVLKQLNYSAKFAASLSPIPHLAELGRDESFDCLYGAPTVIIVSALTDAVAPDKDASAATQNMLLAAESMGLGSCWIHFVIFAFDSAQNNKLRSLLKIPKGFDPYTAAVFGHKTDNKVQTVRRNPSAITII